MRKSIQIVCEEIANLDAAGTALVFIQSDSFADIVQVAENYHLRREYEVESVRKLNLYDVSGGYIREFGSSLAVKDLNNSYTKSLFLNCLVESIYDPEPQMMFVHNFTSTFGNGKTMDSAQEKLFCALHELCEAKAQGKNRTLILVAAQSGKIPKRYAEFSYLLDVPYPETEEIKEVIDESLRECMDVDYFHLSVPLMNELAEAFRGFRANEIRNVIERAFATIEFPLENGAEALLQHITTEKKQILKKTGGLQWIEPDCEKVAGLELLLEWIERQKMFFHEFAACAAHQEYPPKGVLVAGVPGSGKSLTAKNMARIWGIPLLKMDMGSLMGKYLGQSEINVARAIRLAEALSPCVLWIDELEKAFAGVNSDSDDNQSLMRIFNSFLTWMQDRKKPCFVFATANHVSRLPVEFLRKERFDDKFYVFMPTQKECSAILTAHLSSKMEAFKELQDIRNRKEREEVFLILAKKIADKMLACCAEQGKFLTGADIASIVKSAFRSLFIDRFPRLSDKDKQLAASRRVLYYTSDEVASALIHELEETKTYGENMDQVCDYWLSLLDDNPFRSASVSSGGNYNISQENFDKETGEFDWNGIKKGNSYQEELQKKLEIAKKAKNYDDCFALTMAVRLKERLQRKETDSYGNY